MQQRAELCWNQMSSQSETAPVKLAGVARALLVLSLFLTAAGMLLLMGKAGTTASVPRASAALGSLYVSWLLLFGSVCLGVAVWVKSRRLSWWTVVGVAVLVGLSWLVGCELPKAVLS